MSLLIPAACALLGILFAAQQYLLRGQGQWLGPITWKQAFLDQLSYWFLWAMLSLLILFFSRRFPVERPHRNRNLAIHLSTSFIIALLHLMLYIATSSWLLEKGSFLSISTGSVKSQLLMLISLLPGMIIYGIILVFNLASLYYKQYREAIISSLELKSHLTQSQLQFLKMQIHPHFLFNTLHSISALIVKNENRVAVRMISRLSDLLRLALENEETQLVPLKQELNFLERYLEIEQIRFQDRLTVSMDIDQETIDAQVPNLILQPLVENAIRHGIAPYSWAGKINISARRKDKTLWLQVSDDGPGISEKALNSFNAGIGIRNTKARLERLYGAAYNFDLRNNEQGGATVILRIPYCLVDEKVKSLEAI